MKASIKILKFYNFQVVVVGGGQDHKFEGVYYEVVEDDHGGKKGRKGKKSKKNKKKGSKKILKHIRPILMGVAALKMIMDHFLLKKLAFFSFFTFMLSKISFILATLVALKQFFHNSGGHSRAESNKLEVIHIPIKKFVKKHPSEEWDESKIVPMTFSSNSHGTLSSTASPYFTYPSHDSFISSEEHDDFVPKVNGAGEFNFDNSGSAIDEDDFDRSDKLKDDEKSYYINHVHSPFV